MEFNNNSNMQTGTRYTHTTDDIKTTEAAHIVSSNGSVSPNTKPYLVGLSDKKNVPLKSEAAAARFEPKPIEVNGVTEYYWEKK